MLGAYLHVFFIVVCIHFRFNHLVCSSYWCCNRNTYGIKKGGLNC